MLKKNWLFGTVVAVLGLVPLTAVYANADCQAPEALVTPTAIFGFRPLASFAATAPAADSDLRQITTPFRFKLMSPVLESDTDNWQMPPGRYWFSLEVIEAKVTQEGTAIPHENIESWLLEPADSLAVPF